MNRNDFLMNILTATESLQNLHMIGEKGVLIIKR